MLVEDNALRIAQTNPKTKRGGPSDRRVARPNSERWGPARIAADGNRAVAAVESLPLDDPDGPSPTRERGTGRPGALYRLASGEPQRRGCMGTLYVEGEPRSAGHTARGRHPHAGARADDRGGAGRSRSGVPYGRPRRH